VVFNYSKFGSNLNNNFFKNWEKWTGKLFPNVGFQKIFP